MKRIECNVQTGEVKEIPLTEREIAEAAARTAEEAALRKVVQAKAALSEIDAKSIRALREWVATQPTAPQFLKDREAEAASERAKLR